MQTPLLKISLTLTDNVPSKRSVEDKAVIMRIRSRGMMMPLRKAVVAKTLRSEWRMESRMWMCILCCVYNLIVMLITARAHLAATRRSPMTVLI